MDLANYIAGQLGLNPELVASLLLGIGALVVALGVALLGVSALSLTRDERPSDRDNWRMVSKLLPLLAQDTLDPDLRAVYQKSLYLDALIADVAPTLASQTGTELGRKTRRELLAIEARRFRQPNAEVDASGLEQLHARLDTVIERAEQARPATPDDVRELAEMLGGSRRGSPTFIS
ncbi:MAG: hypothetical protein ACQEVA_00180 [Myxococcota bacterium]